MNKERISGTLPGIPMLVILVAAAIALPLAFIWYIVAVLEPAGDAVNLLQIVGLLLFIVAGVVTGIGFGGLTPVSPNEARAVVLFGRYRGTVHEQGLHWVNPFTIRRRISVRVRNFETAKLKVNDHDGNPI